MKLNHNKIICIKLVHLPYLIVINVDSSGGGGGNYGFGFGLETSGSSDPATL